MSLLNTLFRRRERADSPPTDQTPTPGLASWEGADRWPTDDAPAPDLASQDVDVWINADPGRPSATPL
ncbi:hypothetical protein [Actinotalea sp. C106]|uniref:hypothetical protein n=1 Tax=Actinotalea sp. C106 TaxID=2908644 RepID=UPI002027DA7F|nr:hypothetical protein [Actinotalea sp. C106]